MKKHFDYENIQMLCDLLKNAARTDDATMINLYGVTKDEAISNIIKILSKENRIVTINNEVAQ